MNPSEHQFWSHFQIIWVHYNSQIEQRKSLRNMLYEVNNV